METFAAAAVALLAIALTYVCCVRPMRQGRCGTHGTGRRADDDLRRELELAQAELELLRLHHPRQRCVE